MAIRGVRSTMAGSPTPTCEPRARWSTPHRQRLLRSRREGRPSSAWLHLHPIRAASPSATRLRRAADCQARAHSTAIAGCAIDAGSTSDRRWCPAPASDRKASSGELHWIAACRPVPPNQLAAHRRHPHPHQNPLPDPMASLCPSASPENRFPPRSLRRCHRRRSGHSLFGECQHSSMQPSDSLHPARHRDEHGHHRPRPLDSAERHLRMSPGPIASPMTLPRRLLQRDSTAHAGPGQLTTYPAR